MLGIVDNRYYNIEYLMLIVFVSLKTPENVTWGRNETLVTCKRISGLVEALTPLEKWPLVTCLFTSVEKFNEPI